MVDELDRNDLSRPELRRLQKAIYDSVAGEIVAALPKSPPSFGGNKIDDALRRVVPALAKSGARITDLNPLWQDSIGRAIGEYIILTHTVVAEPIRDERVIAPSLGGSSAPPPVNSEPRER